MLRFVRFCFCLLACVCTLSALPSGRAFASGNSYFDMSEVRSKNLVSFPKWNKMIVRHRSQQKAPSSECGATRFNPCEAVQWRDFIRSIQGNAFKEQLKEVNDWGNKHPYVEDQLNWGMTDYWETPFEFMEINGDCEDYAITKYYSLRALGVSAERMRIIIVQDFNLGGVIHAVLGVYDNDDTLYILDNQIKQVMPALGIYHYRPIFGINEDAWWAYTPRIG